MSQEMLHARLNAPVNIECSISVVQCSDSAKQASLVIAQQEERIKELERFAKGCIFTMRKARKHNELSGHDNEMIRQRIELEDEILAKGD